MNNKYKEIKNKIVYVISYEPKSTTPPSRKYSPLEDSSPPPPPKISKTISPGTPLQNSPFDK